MKFVLRFLLIAVLLNFICGYYIKSLGNLNGEIIIGIGVLVVAFVLMPLFIYHRYKNKDLSNFKMKNFWDEVEKRKDKDDLI